MRYGFGGRVWNVSPMIMDYSAPGTTRDRMGSTLGKSLNQSLQIN